MYNGLKTCFLNVKQKAKKMKKEIGALYLAYKRDDVPFYAKLVSILVVGYALSPIDLIPDFIPILGYVDDLILIPLGIMFAVKLIPAHIMNECRQQSENIFKKGKPKNWIVGGIIICIWIIIITYILLKFIRVKINV
ncbi:YkvA family protein [Clostridium sp. JS66]|uniref:YkvA family protein n=1 Tax=Clostridium sp. JS66 TaxID=3064705 RepID=UPI00298E2658|nr:YkvA family protein [Clostridium sp. JS66]WPC44356.1 YkvA family protein [Clostridium sp. JS66]